MATNFITNAADVKTLKTRLRQLVSHSQELKFLVGFFYFSGWQELFENIKNRDDIVIKLLVGLQVDQWLGNLHELAIDNQKDKKEEKVDSFFTSLEKGLNSADLDNEYFYEQVGHFLEMLEHDQLIIRKTKEPNHAKLYFFKIAEDRRDLVNSKFITGSSNLTSAGIHRQGEFNVEISDYGTEEAEAYFDELWERAIPISEHYQRKQYIIDFLRNRSQVAAVTPFEAYTLALKTYLDLQAQKQIKPQVIRLMEENGYEPYSYQIDAVNQALSVIDAYQGVIIADVVGLGKSIIASAIGRNLGKRGMVICPPGLIGDDNGNAGWQKYLKDFNLNSWEVRSNGKLEEVSEYLNDQGDDIEVVVVDEVHRFRNQSTASYELLSNICRNRITILMTATPFNNSPADIFSLLKLFMIPGQSAITRDKDLQGQFREYQRQFNHLSYIQKNYNSELKDRREKAEKLYHSLFGELPIDIQKVNQRSKSLANEIRGVIEPVTIRRNRLDLKKDWKYSQEISSLSEVDPPRELFFDLTQDQSKFYDKVIHNYFGANGYFKGAIYQPFKYEEEVDEEELDKEGNRKFQQQRNLFEFMKRLLVKRFESSFGAFAKSLETFARVHSRIQTFIKNSGEKFILDRQLIEKIYSEDNDAIEEALEEYAEKLQKENKSGTHRVYNVNNFFYNDTFKKDIEHDKQLINALIKEVEQLDLVNNDPKLSTAIEGVQQVLNGDYDNQQVNRKVVIFTEFKDTVDHIKAAFTKCLGNRVFAFDGQLNRSNAEKINQNFDAGIKEAEQKDNYDVIITTDKLSEGVNLNRAGAVINYDIPWNPTRVVQRLGRINRIGKKVFNKLFTFNFFPTEKGSDIVKSREIAAQKMFLIHQTLGEDAKIFHDDETPSASELYSRLRENPEEAEEESLMTSVRNQYNNIQQNHPEVIKRIEGFPSRIKTAKATSYNELMVLRRKGLSLFSEQASLGEENNISVSGLTFDQALPRITAAPETKRQSLSPQFWNLYEAVKTQTTKQSSFTTEASLENKALNNLRTAIQNFRNELEDLLPFIRVLVKDLQYYNTLSDYSMKRITSNELAPNSSDKVIESFKKEIINLRRQLGEDYLNIIEERAKRQTEEIVIAVENQKR